MERKTLPLNSVQLKMADDESGTFTGYASTFGNVDSYGDTIEPGAFKATLKANPNPKMFFNHDSYFSPPIGKWVELVEDDVGLFVRGQLTPGLTLANDIHAAMKHGTIDGISIGFRVSGEDYEQLDNGGRRYLSITELVEASVVTFPADKFARVDLDSVKSAIKAGGTLTDLERYLCEAGQFSRSASRFFVHEIRERAKSTLREAEEARSTDELNAVAVNTAAWLRRMNHNLSVE